MHQERCAQRVAWDLAIYIYKLKSADKATFYTLIEARVVPAPTSKRPVEREFVVDSGASKKNQAQMNWMLREDPEPTVVLTANGEVHTNEEAQVFVHDLNLFVKCNYWKKRVLFCRMENCAKTTDIPLSGSPVKNHS